MQVIFELYRELHALNNEPQVKLATALRKNLIEVQLCDPAELLGQKLRHLPLFWEYVECGARTLSCLFQNALKPSESSSSVFEA